MIRIKTISIALCAAVLAAQSAQAHIVLAEPKSAPGAYYAGFFRVGHGCDGAATVALRIEVPVNVTDAKPQPKPGWTLEIERAPLDKPIESHGKTVRDRVAAVTWRGRLGDDRFDQFGLLMKLPEATGLLYFPVVQRCEKGEMRWTDIPLEGQAWHDMPHPAPVLIIEPSDGAAEMHHH